MESVYITLTGLAFYYGTKPFKLGRCLVLIKDKENSHDTEAVRAVLPYIGTVAYVANSTHTVIMGTHSAGRIYDTFDTAVFARVAFITSSSVICELLPKNHPEAFTVEVDIKTLLKYDDPTAPGQAVKEDRIEF